MCAESFQTEAVFGCRIEWLHKESRLVRCRILADIHAKLTSWLADEINRENPIALHREVLRKIHRGRGFSRAPFEVNDRDNLQMFTLTDEVDTDAQPYRFHPNRRARLEYLQSNRNADHLRIWVAALCLLTTSASNTRH